MAYTPTTKNLISTLNARAASTLAPGATYQGASEDVSKFGRAGISIHSDNATDGTLTVEVSRDGVIWGGPDRTISDARFAQPHMWNIVEKYFRVKYTNGTTSAANLTIQVQYSVNSDTLLGHQLDETLLDETEAIVTRSVLVGQVLGGSYVNVPVAHDGKLRVDMPQSAFGELLVAELTPKVQIRFPYGLNPRDGFVRSSNAASSHTDSGGLLSMTAAPQANSMTLMKTLDLLQYKPGEGFLFRGTCMFTAGVADSWQMYGLGDDEEGFNFGYNETAFGIQHRAFGSNEIRTLAITGVADATGGDFTVTLDGDPVTVTVGANATVPEICAAIVAAEADFHLAGHGWHPLIHDNSSVHFASFRAFPPAGAFSFADVDSGVTSSGFTTTITGVAPTTNNWVPQTAWNVDRMDGSGDEFNPSGGLLDPEKLNVFQIRGQYLGAGGIRFYIEDTVTAEFVPVHTIRYAGSATVPTMRNPSRPLGMIVLMGSGYAGPSIAMSVASMAGFVEGTAENGGLRFSASGQKSTTGATAVNVLTIHSEAHMNGTCSRIEAFPTTLSLSNDTGKTVTFEVLENAIDIGGVMAFNPVDALSSSMQYDTAGTTVTGGSVLGTYVLSGGASNTFDISRLGHLRPGDRWTVAAVLSSGADDTVSAGIDWDERV